MAARIDGIAKGGISLAIALLVAPISCTEGAIASLLWLELLNHPARFAERLEMD